MGAILNIKRSQLDETMDNYDQSAKVTAAVGEDSDAVRRFKYACGKNANTMRALFKEAGAKVRALHFSVKDMEAFRLATNELADKLSDKDEDGKSVTDDEGNLVINENKDAFGEGLELLKKEHATAIAKQDAVTKKIDDYLDETVTVPIFQVPFSTVPEKIGGAFIDMIAPMLTDVPDM